MKEALKFVTDFLLVHKTMDEAALTYKATDLTQLFLLKKVAMVVANGELARADCGPGAAPDGHAGRRDAAGQQAGPDHPLVPGRLAAVRLCERRNPQGGLELLKWMYDTEFYADYTQRTKGAAIPVTKAALNSPFYTNDPIRSVLVKQMETAVRYGGPLYGTTPYMGEAEGKLLFSQPVGDVMNGKRGVDDAVAFLNSELKTLAGQ